MDFVALSQACAPTVAASTMAALVAGESSYNPLAIAVVGTRLVRQPRSVAEAVATAKALEAAGWNFSIGLAQINRHNLPKYKINYTEAFDACTSLRVGSKILEDCFLRASKVRADPQDSLKAAFSCYYSGNFTRGFSPDQAGKPSYVQKVMSNARLPIRMVKTPP